MYYVVVLLLVFKLFAQYDSEFLPGWKKWRGEGSLKTHGGIMFCMSLPRFAMGPRAQGCPNSIL